MIKKACRPLITCVSSYQQSEQRGANRFYGEFLAALFFEAFAKPEADRSQAAIALTGRIPYLNGGLFLPHKLELDADHALRLGKTLHVADEAFKGIFDLLPASPGTWTTRPAAMRTKSTPTCWATSLRNTSTKKPLAPTTPGPRSPATWPTAASTN
jgi:hypothetical protein